MTTEEETLFAIGQELKGVRDCNTPSVNAIRAIKRLCDKFLDQPTETVTIIPMD